MALTIPVGTKVVITRGEHKGKRGTVKLLDRKHVVVELDNGVVLHAVSDNNTERA